jgi:hypothetical protein
MTRVHFKGQFFLAPEGQLLLALKLYGIDQKAG